jgi:large subunit ribosomal protein L19
MIKQINFAPGDLVKVYQKITEGDKTRTQVFQGTVLKIRGRGENKTFTVRKFIGGTFVERIYPVNSPNIEKVEVKGKIKSKIRRSKLYHIRKEIK